MFLEDDFKKWFSNKESRFCRIGGCRSTVVSCNPALFNVEVRPTTSLSTVSNMMMIKIVMTMTIMMTMIFIIMMIVQCWGEADNKPHNIKTWNNFKTSSSQLWSNSKKTSSQLWDNCQMLRWGWQEASLQSPIPAPWPFRCATNSGQIITTFLKSNCHCVAKSTYLRKTAIYYKGLRSNSRLQSWNVCTIMKFAEKKF